MHKDLVTNGLMALGMALALGGCASTDTRSASTDPWESPNRAFYEFNDSLDRNFFTPVAKGYVWIAPKPIRASVTNAFQNVSYLNVIANDALQGKFGTFASDTGRFVVNSTLGLGGLFDPATHIGLPEHEEDLGQTFGKWGMGEGRYLVVPLMGPNSLRDLPNVASSMALNPLTYLNAVVTVPLGVLNAINARANLLDESNIRDQAALDPYTFVREAYRQRREFLIYDGNPPSDSIDDYLDDTSATPAAAPPESGAAVLKVY